MKTVGFDPNRLDATVWDDSFIHDAWNEGTTARVALVFHVHHPDFCDMNRNRKVFL